MLYLERPRIRQFRESVAALIPCDPESARADLYEMGLSALLGRYVNWADRFVAPRPRRVITWDGFLRHGSAQLHQVVLSALLAKIERGDNLKPYLSDRIERCGHLRSKPKKSSKAKGVEWGDKDYALNAFETHHLHLDPAGTEELLYVIFSRGEAFLVMVGDHNSFDDGTLAEALAEARVGTSAELRGVLGSARHRTIREQNQLQRHGFTTIFDADCHTVMGAMLSTAGTSPFHTIHGDRIVQLIESLDLQVDEPGFCRTCFEQNRKAYPATPLFEWAMQYCDLYLVESTTSVGFPMLQWRR